MATARYACILPYQNNISDCLQFQNTRKTESSSLNLNSIQFVVCGLYVLLTWCNCDLRIQDYIHAGDFKSCGRLQGLVFSLWESVFNLLALWVCYRETQAKHCVEWRTDMIKVRHCGLVVSVHAWDRTGHEFDSWQCRIYIISHVHWAYDYLGPIRVLWVHMAWHKNCVEKKSGLDISVSFVVPNTVIRL